MFVISSYSWPPTHLKRKLSGTQKNQSLFTSQNVGSYLSSCLFTKETKAIISNLAAKPHLSLRPFHFCSYSIAMRFRFPEWALPAVIIFVENGTIRSSVETSVLVGVMVKNLFFSIFTDPLENEYQATLIF